MPFSSLFIIVAKALNVAIKNAMRIGLVKSILLPQSTSQQIICRYVDDTSFSARAEDSSVDNLIKILYNFEFVSGLEMNWHKSVAYWCGRGTPPECGDKSWKVMACAIAFLSSSCLEDNLQLNLW